MTRRTDPWLLASWAGLAVLVVLVARFGADAGVTWDELVHHEYGEAVLAWYRSGFADRRALEYRNLYLYGGLFDAPAQLAVRASYLAPFETRHVLTALAGVLGVVAAWRTAALLGGPRAGFLAAALLVLTPAWTGHALMNPKDIPFGAAAAWVFHGAVRLALAPAPASWGTFLAAGAALGVALGVRPGGIFLAAWPAAAAAAAAALALPGARGRRAALAGAVALRLAAALALAWTVMLACWPWAQQAPLVRPFQAAGEAARFAWNGLVLFDGAYVSADALPRSYLPVWFAITLPELWLLAAACGAVAAALALRRARDERPRLLALGLLAAGALAAPAAAAVLRTPLYDAHRHFLFVLPPAAALAGVGLSAFLASPRLPRLARAGVAALGAALAALVVVDMVRLHPYEYVFFNRASGGLAAAAGRFETDYWGASYREGLEWLVASVDPTGPTPLRVAGRSEPAQVSYYLERWSAARGRFAAVDRLADADVVLSTTRWDRHRLPGVILHVVERQGVPLLYVIGRLPPAQPPPP